MEKWTQKLYFYQEKFFEKSDPKRNSTKKIFTEYFFQEKIGEKDIFIRGLHF